MDFDDILRVLDYYDDRAFARRARRRLGIKPGSTVHHVDGDPRNNDSANLRIVDPKETGQ